MHCCLFARLFVLIAIHLHKFLSAIGIFCCQLAPDRGEGLAVSCQAHMSLYKKW